MSHGEDVATDLFCMKNVQQFARTGLPVRARRQAQISSWVLKGDMISTRETGADVIGGGKAKIGT